MKKEIIVWQVIVLVLGLSLIFTLHQYLQKKSFIEERAAYANCWIGGQNTDVSVKSLCDPIIFGVEVDY